MQCNVGKKDRLARLAAGAVFILLAIFVQNWIVGAIGVVMIGTALVRFCPAYTLLKMDTNKFD